MENHRTHYCGDLRAEHSGGAVCLVGWVQRRRDLGKLTFITLRDRSGICQVIFDAEGNSELHQAAKEIRSEFVVRIAGMVQKRRAGMENPEMATGEIEVRAAEMQILNQAKTPPFGFDDPP